MPLLPEPSTEITLLERLKREPADQDAWRLFVERYGPHIYNWCRHWSLQAADAQDVTQTVLKILVVRLKTFIYDPELSFCGWLRTVTRNACTAFLESREREPVGTGDEISVRLLNSLAARDDLVHRLEEEFDHELLDLAAKRVKQRVEAHTWEAFRLTALQGVPAAQVSERLQIKLATVYIARSKIQRLLREEMRRLDREPE